MGGEWGKGSQQGFQSYSLGLLWPPGKDPDHRMENSSVTLQGQEVTPKMLPSCRATAHLLIQYPLRSLCQAGRWVDG
jgi:hypothetical protein